MPKHQASLNFLISERVVSSQYDKDGELVVKIEIDKPRSCWLPMRAGVANYALFRGMLMKSLLYFKGKVGFSVLKRGSARLTLGDHPKAAPLRALDISREPLFTAFIPSAEGILDDSCQSWFVHSAAPPQGPLEGMESVVNLGLSQEWPPPPKERA